MLQKVAGLFDAKPGQILLGGLLKNRLEGAEELASAETHVGGDSLHSDRVGIVGAYVLDALLHIGVGCVPAFLSLSIFDEKREGGAEPSGHLHCVAELVSSGVVDVKELVPDFIAGRHLKDAGRLRSKIRCAQNHGRITAVKADPGIFPGVSFVCPVNHLRIRIHQKGISGGQLIDGTAHPVGAMARDNVVDQVMISYSGPPLVARIAELAAHVIDGERDQLFFRGDIGVFIFLIHGKPRFVWSVSGGQRIC